MIGPRDAEVVFDFREDVLQRGRHRHAGAHRKAQTVGLARPVIRILAQDHHFHRIERRGIHRRKNFGTRRIDALAREFLGAQEFAQRVHVRPIEVIADVRFPRRLKFQACVGHGAAGSLKSHSSANERQ